MSEKKEETPGAMTTPGGKIEGDPTSVAITIGVGKDGEIKRLSSDGEVVPGQQVASVRETVWSAKPGEQDPTKPDEEKT